MDKAGNGFCFFVRSRKVRERYFCCKSLFSRSLVEVVSFLYFRERMPKLNQDESPFYRHFFF